MISDIIWQCLDQEPTQRPSAVVCPVVKKLLLDNSCQASTVVSGQALLCIQIGYLHHPGPRLWSWCFFACSDIELCGSKSQQFSELLRLPVS